MRLHFVLARNLSITTTIMALALAAGAGAPALAAPAAHQATPDDTQEWGNDRVRLAVSQPSTLSLGTSGASVLASSSDNTSSIDYCVEIDLADDSSGPYRLQFHIDGASGDPSSSAPGPIAAAHRAAARAPRRGAAATGPRLPTRSRRMVPLDVYLDFDLSTEADAYVTTTGDTGLVGTIYDASDDVVASDSSDTSRMSGASLPAGDYTLELDGSDDLTGTFTVVADQGTCGG